VRTILRKDIISFPLLFWGNSRVRTCARDTTHRTSFYFPPPLHARAREGPRERSDDTDGSETWEGGDIDLPIG